MRNHSEIANPAERTIKLLGINLCLTLVMEFIWRESFVRIGLYPENTGFFVDSNLIGINQNSLINLSMTGFATLFGSWVLFGKRRSSRFVGFIVSGVVIAAVSQLTVNAFTGAAIAIGLNRISFDIFYTCAVKFPMFEFGRKTLIAGQASILLITAVRLFQDATMSAIRIGLLNEWHLF